MQLLQRIFGITTTGLSRLGTCTVACRISLRRVIHMANDTGAETQVRSTENAGAPDSTVNEDTRSPAAADAGASDSAASEDSGSPTTTADAGSSDDITANADY